MISDPSRSTRFPPQTVRINFEKIGQSLHHENRCSFVSQSQLFSVHTTLLAGCTKLHIILSNNKKNIFSYLGLMYKKHSSKISLCSLKIVLCAARIEFNCWTKFESVHTCCESVRSKTFALVQINVRGMCCSNTVRFKISVQRRSFCN